MNGSSDIVGFRVVGPDKALYGPVDLPGLIQWVRDERVVAGTWVYVEHEDAWKKAARVTELQIFFDPSRAALPEGGGAPGATAEVSTLAVDPALLHRVKVLAELSHGQLERFLDYAEVLRLPLAAQVVRRGTPGDAMYMILEGELRVSLVVTGTEKMLTILGAGEFFGEGCVFDHGVRSADVVTHAPCTLLKVSTEAFERLMSDAPDIATPILFAMGKTLTARIRADNHRYGNALAFGPGIT